MKRTKERNKKTDFSYHLYLVILHLLPCSLNSEDLNVNTTVKGLICDKSIMQGLNFSDSEISASAVDLIVARRTRTHLLSSPHSLSPGR